LRFRPFRCARLARRDTNVSWRCQPRPAFLLRSGLAVARPTLIVVVHSRQGLPPPTAARARSLCVFATDGCWRAHRRRYGSLSHRSAPSATAAWRNDARGHARADTLPLTGLASGIQPAPFRTWRVDACAEGRRSHHRRPSGALYARVTDGRSRAWYRRVRLLPAGHPRLS